MSTKQSDQEFAQKLVLLYVKDLASKAIAIGRGDFTQKELRKIIKDFQQIYDTLH